MELRAERTKAIVTEIKLLRERKATFSEIAEIFNKKGRKTPFGKQWEKRNVFNFYNRHK